MIGEVYEDMAQFQRRGSNWRFEEVLKLELHLVDFVPLKGNSWISLPEAICKKKAVINMKNGDDECFMWCVARALNLVYKNAERVDKQLRKQAEELNWKGTRFPMEVDKIDEFEKMNEGIFVNVFFYLNRGVQPLRISGTEKEHNIDLLLIVEDGKNHYCFIKNLSRLLSKQVTKHKEPNVFCRRYLNHFPNNEIEVCLEFYQLDPAWYYTAPGLAWDAALKKTEVQLQLLTDPDMLLMFEEGIRGGVSMITKRHGKTNNPYILLILMQIISTVQQCIILFLLEVLNG